MPKYNPNSMVLHCLNYDNLGGGVLRNYIHALHEYENIESEDHPPIHIPLERDGVVIGPR